MLTCKPKKKCHQLLLASSICYGKLFCWEYADCMFRWCSFWNNNGFSVASLYNSFVCMCVWVYGAVSWWKPSADAYIRAPALIKGQQAVLLSLWEQHRFLLLLWQQDKVPFQLEKYLATYLPTAILGFYFSCHLIRNPCYFYSVLSYHRVPGMHMLMRTPLLHHNAV